MSDGIETGGRGGSRRSRWDSSGQAGWAVALAMVLCLGLVWGSGCQDTDLEAPILVSDPDVSDIETSEVLLPDCDRYCSRVFNSETCQGEGLELYRDRVQCMEICDDYTGWEMGQFGQGQGNTVGCRMNSLQLADQDPANALRHCSAAGRTGGGVCGSLCDVYCDVMQRNCQNVPLVLVDRAECMQECVNLDSTGHHRDERGNTLQCRINHLIWAGSPEPGEDSFHCPHGALNAAPPCTGDPPGAEHDH